MPHLSNLLCTDDLFELLIEHLDLCDVSRLRGVCLEISRSISRSSIWRLATHPRPVHRRTWLEQMASRAMLVRDASVIRWLLDAEHASHDYLLRVARVDRLEWLVLQSILPGCRDTTRLTSRWLASLGSLPGLCRLRDAGRLAAREVAVAAAYEGNGQVLRWQAAHDPSSINSCVGVVLALCDNLDLMTECAQSGMPVTQHMLNTAARTGNLAMVRWLESHGSGERASWEQASGELASGELANGELASGELANGERASASERGASERERAGSERARASDRGASERERAGASERERERAGSERARVSGERASASERGASERGASERGAAGRARRIWFPQAALFIHTLYTGVSLLKIALL